MPTTTSKPAHGLSIHGKIDKLIAKTQQDLDALLRTREMLHGVLTNGKVHTHASVLERAVELDAERREAVRGPYKKRSSQGGAVARAKKSDRKRTAKFLAKVGASAGPYTKEHGGRVSVLLQHGYLKKQGEGYVRTEKVFTP